ncbi:uncharacterized protein J8A68_000099 [[Candida] subhashii]|uniref:Hyphally-regulated cell wall protein N-terminal domain-containing protein n=1 Tax=[Candida] subhashii TaxID=561895 RepID=A0A8J5QUZ6_9ASCO|nr:uncharacterized protein J8A68_000099 [[Candida] subhashii]KAG7666354.1 hypothetical protein J8A68_000099 [[Candida] subhashii]
MLNHLHLLLPILVFISFSNCIQVEEELILRGDIPDNENYEISGTLSLVDVYGPLGTINVNTGGELFYTWVLGTSSLLPTISFGAISNNGIFRFDTNNRYITPQTYEFETIENFAQMEFKDLTNPSLEPRVNTLKNYEDANFFVDVGSIVISELMNSGKMCIRNNALVAIEKETKPMGNPGCIQLSNKAKLMPRTDLLSKVCFSANGEEGTVLDLTESIPSIVWLAQFGGTNVIRLHVNVVWISYNSPYLEIGAVSGIVEEFTLDVGPGYDQSKFIFGGSGMSILDIKYSTIPAEANICTCNCEFLDPTEFPGTMPTISTQTTLGRTETLTITTTDDRWTTITPQVEPETSTFEETSTISEPEATTSEPESTTSEEESTTAGRESATSEIESTTTEPESSASEIESTTSEAESTTSEPESTTSEEELTTAGRESATSEIESTTTEPESSASEIESTTSEAESSTSEPESTTSSELESTSEIAATTSEPESTIVTSSAYSESTSEIPSGADSSEQTGSETQDSSATDTEASSVPQDPTTASPSELSTVGPSSEPTLSDKSDATRTTMSSTEPESSTTSTTDTKSTTMITTETATTTATDTTQSESTSNKTDTISTVITSSFTKSILSTSTTATTDKIVSTVSTVITITTRAVSYSAGTIEPGKTISDITVPASTTGKYASPYGTIVRTTSDGTVSDVTMMISPVVSEISGTTGKQDPTATLSVASPDATILPIEDSAVRTVSGKMLMFAMAICGFAMFV